MGLGATVLEMFHHHKQLVLAWFQGVAYLLLSLVLAV
jgi:hypothetical protein